MPFEETVIVVENRIGTPSSNRSFLLLKKFFFFCHLKETIWEISHVIFFHLSSFFYLFILFIYFFFFIYLFFPSRSHGFLSFKSCFFSLPLRCSSCTQPHTWLVLLEHKIPGFISQNNAHAKRINSFPFKSRWYPPPFTTYSVPNNSLDSYSSLFSYFFLSPSYLICFLQHFLCSYPTLPTVLPNTYRFPFFHLFLLPSPLKSIDRFNHLP